MYGIEGELVAWIRLRRVMAIKNSSSAEDVSREVVKLALSFKEQPLSMGADLHKIDLGIEEVRYANQLPYGQRY